MKRWISMLLSLVMLMHLLPTRAFAAENNGISVKEIRFYSDCEIDSYKVISGSEGSVDLSYSDSGNPYKFEITFSDPGKVGHAYVSSTASNGQKYIIDAVYDSDSGRFVAEGFFDPSNKFFEPDKINVEFTPKTTAPKVGSAVDWDSLQEHVGEELSGSKVSNTNSGNSSSGTVALSGVGELNAAVLNYGITAMDDKTADEMTALRDSYTTGTNVLSYVVPGLDDSRYHAYLDMSDPNTYKVLVDDGLSVGSKAVELTMEAFDASSSEYRNLADLAGTLSTVSTVASFVGETYNIHQEMSSLQAEIQSASHLSSDEKKTAIQDAKKLENSQIVFALAVTALPIIVTGGAATPAAAALFTSMIGVMSAASDVIYDHRIAGIRAATVSTKWAAAGEVLAEYVGDGVYRTYNKSSRVLTYTTETQDTTNNGNEYISQYWAEIETMVIEDGVTEMFDAPPNITSVSIPGSVTEISGAPFSGCGKLEHIVIPEGVTALRNATFSNCASLKSITLPSTLKEVTQNGGYVYATIKNCPALTDIYFNGTMGQWDAIKYIQYMFEEGYTEEDYNVHMTPSGWIGDNIVWELDESNGKLTFSGIGEMDEIPETESGDYMYPWRRIFEDIRILEIREGITELPPDAFRDLPNLTAVSLPNTLEWMWTSVFAGCTTLSAITIPKSVTEMYDGCFEGCTSLKKVVIKGNLSNGLFDNMFSDCSSLTSVTLPGNLNTIWQNAFLNCTALKEITLPDNLHYIARSAFAGCSSLETITIPKTVSPIEVSVFSGCNSLTTIHYGSTPAFWNYFPCSQEEPCLSATKTYQSEGICGWDYSSDLLWDFEEDTGRLVIEGNGTMADFYPGGDYNIMPIPWQDYLEDIQTVVIKSGVKNIGDRAFDRCTNLSSITIPDTVTDIGEFAFWRCTGLTKVKLPAKLEKIDYKAFSECTNLANVNLPDSLTTIGKEAFAGCALTEVIIPKNVTYINEAAFGACTALTKLVLHDGITVISDSAFSGCMNLMDFELPKNLYNIGDSAFSGCGKITKITIPAGVTRIDGNAFSQCTSLKQLHFLGDAPQFSVYGIFYDVEATAYYPAGNETWTEDVMRDYGGKITWQAACVGEHTIVIDEAVDPTCVDTGLTEGSHCSACGMVIVAQEVIPATGEHDYENGICSVCGEPEAEELAAPVISTANVASSGKIKISWDAVDGASKYYIYRKVGSNGSYKYLTSTTKTSLTNTSTEAGTTYYYKVRAVDADGNKSDYSNVSYRTCDLARPVVTLSNITPTGKIKLSWDAIDGAQKYYIYRRVGSSGEYKYYTSTTMTSLNNTSTEAGTTYYYKVKAVHENSAANSAYSSAKSRTCDLPSPLLKISNVVSSGKIKLTWDAVDGAVKYYVYRSTSKDGTYNYLYSTTKTSFTNTGAEAGRTYYYKVKAVHENSAANSSYSSVAGKLCKLARPVVSITLSSSGKPKLTWDAIDGAEQYHIFRSTQKNGPFVYQYSTIKNSYTNTGAKAGTTYYYKVMAIHANSAANSAYSYVNSITSK